MFITDKKSLEETVGALINEGVRNLQQDTVHGNFEGDGETRTVETGHENQGYEARTRLEAEEDPADNGWTASFGQRVFVYMPTRGINLYPVKPPAASIQR